MRTVRIGSVARLTAIAGAAVLGIPLYAQVRTANSASGTTATAEPRTAATSAFFAPSLLDFAVYATGTNCAAINISGNGYVDSFDSSQGTYAQTKQLSKGIVGTSGNINLSGQATINGLIFSLNTTVGTCANGTPGISLSGTAKATGGYFQLAGVPPFPNPPAVTPGTQDYNLSSNTTLPPGNYSNIAMSGGKTLTFSPGTYNINSITLSGGSLLTMSPAGPVVVNIAGNNVSKPINFSGGSIVNPSGVPLNFQLIYGGNLPLVLSGGSGSYALVYAPNSAATLSGGSDWFGAMTVKTLDDSGGSPIHYDRSLAVPPTITAVLSPVPDMAGWNNSNATVTFTCSDPIVGIASCSPPVQLTTEGANQVVNGTAVNRAGFSATTSVTLSIDKTAPIIGAAANPSPNAAGWNNSNVTVSFVCLDALSGIASCTGPVTVSTERAGQVVAGTALDKAGNMATAAVTINLDKTPPIIKATITPPPDAAGWNNTNVTVSFTCSDALSGVDTCPGPVQVTTEGGNQVITGTAKDKAGNAASVSATVNIDKTAPIITTAAAPAPNAAGWNNGTVNVTFSCSDALSGIDFCSPVASDSTEGANQTVSGTARDKAGNTATASTTLNIDQTPPTLTITSPANGATLNPGPLMVTGTVSDALSGVASVTCQGTVATVSSSTFTCAVQVATGPNAIAIQAIDVAGNTIQASVSVQGGVPVILSMNPNTGQQGQQNLSVIITGQNTHFAQGTTTASLGAGIAVASLTVSSSTAATAILNIDPAASLDPRSVTLTTGSEVVTLLNGFTVLAARPVLLAVDPNSGYPGQETLGIVGSIFLTGHDPDFHATGDFGGNPSGAANINKRAIAFVTDPAFNTFAARGIHKFLYVSASIPAPEGHVDGTKGLIASGYTLGTDFDRSDATTLSADLGQLGTKYDALVVASDHGGILTQAELDILNRHSVDVINFLNLGGGVYAMAETIPAESGLASTGFFGFLPFIVTSTPLSQVENGNTLTSFGTSLGLTNSDMNGNFSHNVFKSSGGLTTVDTNGAGEILSLAGRGVVTSAGVGSVKITGQFTHFAQGKTQVSFGAGITVGTLSVVDENHLTAQITIASSALPGGRTVTVTTGAEIASLLNGFTVWAPPALTAVSPNSGQPGQQNLSVTITGQNTHFVQGTSVASFGAGITVASLTVNTPTTATAVLKIDPAATLGFRTVSATTGAEVASLPNGFTVTPPQAVNQPPTVSATAGCDQSISLVPPQVTMTEYPLPNSGNQPHFIAAGSDCNLWFTEYDANNIGRITPAGVITEFSGLSGFGFHITPGPDGNVWFTEANANKIGKITPSGVITEFSLPTVGSGPVGITAGPDGNLWFTEYYEAGNKIGRITPSGVITEFTALPTSNSVPDTIIAGPDGNLWFTEFAANKIGKITPSGVISEFSIPTASSGAVGITAGLDGNLWFTEELGNKIGRITTAGVITEFSIPTSDGYPVGITAASDGNMWFAEYHQNKIGRINPSGIITEFSLPSGSNVPHGITLGPNGHLWFTECGANCGFQSRPGNKIGDVSPGVTVARLTGSVADDGLPVAANLNTTWSLTSGPAPVSFSTPTATFPNIAGQTNRVVTSATFSVPGTYTLSLTGSDSLLSSSSSITVTVNANQVPTLLSVNPTAGQQGQQNLSVTINGQNTHFIQGTTVASFGEGITVASMMVNSAVTATAVINIDPAAAIGGRTLTLTTGAESASLMNGFTVTLPSGTPVLVTVNPNSGQQGQQNLLVTITGQYTHFGQGTTVSFGTGIAVTTVATPNATSLTAQVSIAANAAVGVRMIAVTTGSEIVSLANGFSVRTADLNRAPQVDAGPDRNIAVANAAFMNGSVTDDGLPLGAPLSISWTVLGAPSVLINEVVRAIGDQLGPGWPALEGTAWQTEFSLSSQPVTDFQITLETAEMNYDDNRIFINDFVVGYLPQNEPDVLAPYTFRVPAQILNNGRNTFRLESARRGSNFDDVRFRRIELFIGNVTFTTPSSPQTEARFSYPGTYTLRLSASDSELTGSDEAIVSVQGLNARPLVNAGTDQAIVISTLANLTGRVIDDGLPLTGTLTVAWSTVSGPGPVTLGNPLAPITTASFGVAGTYVLRLTASDSELSTSADVTVTVTSSSSGAAITSVSPNQAQQGQQNLSVLITGQSTHFVQGTSQASFGAGITVASLTVNSLTSATAILNVDPAAPVGVLDVTVTTSGEIVTLTGAFQVVAKAPLLYAVHGNSQTVSVIDTGTDQIIKTIPVTHTTGGLAVAPDGKHVYVISLYGCYSGTMSVIDTSSNAVVSTITGGTGSFTGHVAVSPDGKTLYASNWCDTTIDVIDTTSNTVIGKVGNVSNASGAIVFSPDGSRAYVASTSGITVIDTGSRTATANIALPLMGASVAIILNQDGTRLYVGDYTKGSVHVIDTTIGSVVATIPTIECCNIEGLSLSSDGKTLYAANNSAPDLSFFSFLAVIDTGTNTVRSVIPVGSQLQQNTDITPDGARVYVSDATFADSHQLLSGRIWVIDTTLNSIIDAIVFPPGVGSQGIGLLPAAKFGPSLPVLSLPVPSTGVQGRSVSISVTSRGTHFVQGVTQVNFGQGITVNSIAILSPTSLTANLTIDPAAVIGSRSLTVTTGLEVAGLAFGFNIEAGTPILVSVSPNSGQLGQSNLSVAITGTFTNFTPYLTRASFGAGIKVNSLTVTDSTHLSASISIAANAATGERDLVVTTGSETDFLANTFAVLSGAPVISFVAPSQGVQGQQNLSITITGQNTNFTQGITQVSFGSDITANNVAVASGTSLTANVTIPLNANVGAHTVTVTSGAEIASLTSGFNVISSTSGATITQISPNSGQQGQSGSVTILGQNTHFVQGTSQVSFGPDITVNNVAVAGPTSLTATIAIPSMAGIGARTVTVTTSGEVVALGNGFTVQAGGPVILSITPNTGEQGSHNLPVTITGQNTHFVQGTTTGTFGAGVSVNGATAGNYGVLTVNSPTSATALLDSGGLSDWSQLATSGTLPPARDRQSAVYVSASNQMIIYGGTPGDPATPPAPFNDVWRLSNANGNGTPTWTQITTQGLSVPGRWAHRAVYDDANDKMIVFAGITGRGYTPCVNDVFVLSNASGVGGVPSWAQLNPQGNAPTPRRNPAAAYDPVSNRLIIFGGFDCGGTKFNDVWVLSNANGLGGVPTWNLLSPQGTAPPAREDAAIAYDATHDRLIVGGPDMWVLQNTKALNGAPTWVQLVTSAMLWGLLPWESVYDSRTNRFIFVAGQQTACTVYGLRPLEVWALDNANGLGGNPTWSRLGPFAQMPVTTELPVYDPFTDKLIMFGGHTFWPDGTFNFVSNQTWTLSNVMNGSTSGPRTVQIQTNSEQVSLVGGWTVNPPASAPPAVMASPTCTGQGESTTITLTGRNTNFVVGSTTASFGPGISTGGGQSGGPGPVSVISTSSAVAQVNVDPAAQQSIRNVVVQMPTSQVTAPNAFYVGSPLTSPVVLTVAPGSGSTGQDLSVTITGANTHFSQNTSQVTFGPDISVTSVTVTSSTSLTAQIVISASANLGEHSVSIRTGSEVASLASGFIVNAARPTLTISPNSGQQGQAGPVAITGQNTHFVQGTSTVDLGSGITVSNVQVTCPTCLTAQVSISSTAPSGPHNVTVTTGGEVATLTGGFTVIAGTPILTSLVPASGQQGQTLQVMITGQYTHFTQGTTQASFGAGITVSNVNVSNPTSLTAQLVIDPAATVGTRTMTVTTGTEVVSVANVFNVQAGGSLPALISLAPGGAQQGQTNLPVLITGQSTHFVQGTTQASFGAGVTVVTLAVAGPTTATATVNIDPAAPLGPRTVTMTTSSEVATYTNGFTVSAGSPYISLVNPNTAQPGQQSLSVVVTGQLTHFAQGTTQASFGAGVTVASVTVTSATSLTAVLNIDSSAAFGLRDVTVTTGTEVASLAGGFAINPGATITQISPGNGQQGQSNITVSMTGQNTHFVQGTTTANFGAGISVGGAAAGASGPVTVTSPTSATAQISIAANAAVGTRTVSMQTGTEQTSAPNAFLVQAAGPVISSVSPNSGQQGQQALTVTVTGQSSHFAQGTSQVSFGAGITVGTVTVASPTSLTAQISIASNAPLGARTVTVTTGTEIASLANAFSVTSAVNQPPVISIAPTWSDTLPNRLLLNYGVSDDGLPAGGTLTVSWDTISTPTGANVGYLSQTLVCSTCPPGPVVTTGSVSAGFDQPGTYVLRITATDSQLTTTQDITVTVTTNNLPPLTVSITSPTDGTEVTAPVSVMGTVSGQVLKSWVLEYQAPGATGYTIFATGTAAVTNGTLGTFDPTTLLNGIASIRLTATDTGNNTTTAGPISLVLTKNEKIGNFTVSFNDLSVPVAGLPIQVVRSYDSRRRAIPGDFSYGWTLDIDTVKVSQTAMAGDLWNATTTGGSFPTYCLQPVKPHVVTVSLPDGTTYTYDVTLTPQCQQLVPPDQVTIGYAPRSGTTASLAVLGNNLAQVSASFPGTAQLYDLDSGKVFDTAKYRLTLPDGRTLDINPTTGLEKMTDLNGNTLTVTSAGIVSSSGKSVTFTRNAAQLITKITDPAGNSINYAYNAVTGDLTAVTDRTNLTTTFTYNSDHGLLTIKDPRGVQPIRNVYDNSGRLIQHIDAYGNTINYTHDTTNRQEIVTDRLGNVTVNEYDTDGNVIKVTDALGGITQRTYDSRDNLLTETNALGKTRTYTYDANNNRLSETDPLGSTTTYTYNNHSQVLTTTDALSRVTTNTYDANGNLLSTKDTAGNVTNYAYNASGLRTSMTDALGNVTAYVYDGAGNLAKQTDALGGVTTYTYDANGNKLSETKTRTTTSGPETLVTSYQYDASNRLTQTTYPDGSTTQIQYNAIGKQSVTIDQLGRQTSYQYDLMGRLTQTTYPDGNSESATYDAEGDRITSTDRAGRTTTYVYDALKRLSQTIYPDTAATINIYDAIGEVTAVKDPLGHTTQYAYDATGRRTKVTDALGQVSTFGYDAVGNQLSMTDANGNTVQHQYDNANRRTKTVYPDSTNDSAGYDALGRTITKTDQAGKTTQYQYDKLGRLTQVTDALNQLTKDTYDELGNRLSQTDANGHTTTFAYDKLGRRTKRTLPLGMSETMTYDAAGNLKTKTDFNGKTTTYAYDVLNRLTSKTPDPSLNQPTVSFTYTQTGQRLSMADASGTTSYQYDLRDRLTQKATPEGTLVYAYDLGSDLTSIHSSNIGGTSVSYQYDALNRLAQVTDNRLASGTTTYSYDHAGNLQGYLYPNGVQTTYQYNQLSRLTNLTEAHGATPQASYVYTLGPSGNRTQVSELGGRTVNYGYDPLYRLTSETIAGGVVNGTIGYVYDPVGNRTSRSSTVAPVPAASYAYDANDRLNTDTYDNNGSTAASGANTYGYDFENHLTSSSSGSVSIVYDGDGNRVAKTASGVTTKYLVDDRNLTGYAQVLEELSGGGVPRVYTYGLNRISQSQASGTSFYGYDGHGNVRLLTDAAGAVTDRYDYDAFGNVIGQSGTTPNVYLYSGEQNDANLGLYYLRARYLSQSTGRFWTMDNVEGDEDSPVSLHKYIYVGNEPVLRLDPSGNQFDIASISLELAVFDVLSSVTTVHGIFPSYLRCRNCSIKNAPEYDQTGSVPRGTMFRWSAEFVKDAGHTPTCCEVRQQIRWNRAWRPSQPAPHAGFQPPEDQPGNWYEDRDASNHRYGRRTGPYSDLHPGFDWYHDTFYDANDTPAGPSNPGFKFKFRLIVVDVCNGDRILHTSRTLGVTF